MIQFLNIAGLGPIFGAIMEPFRDGVLPVDRAGQHLRRRRTRFSGRHDLAAQRRGEPAGETIGRYLRSQLQTIHARLYGAADGAGRRRIRRWAGRAAGQADPESLDLSFWATVVFVYYVLATLLPIDKIIGKIYPIFAIALIFMAAGILFFMIFWHHPPCRNRTTASPIRIRTACRSSR